MNMRSACQLLVLGAGLVAVPAFGAETPSSDAWPRHCAQNLAARHLPIAAVRSYCACMAGLGDDAEMLKWDQKVLEKSYPYAHTRCVDRAAAHRDDNK